MSRRLVVLGAYAWVLIVGIVWLSPAIAMQPLYDVIGLDESETIVTWPGKEPVRVAVVDDAFLANHKLFAGMLARNQNEIANNFKDDDSNGYVDDIAGFDLADRDPDVSPPGTLASEFYHGTHSAGLISQIIRAKLGQLDDYPIKLMFVKAVPDATANFKLEAGYQGIRYATENGAHIVNNSWSGGEPTQDDMQVLMEAMGKDVFVVNTLGNYSQPEMVQPASHRGVFGVAGTDLQGKIYGLTNFGVETDLLSPAEDIKSASSLGASEQRLNSGTSVSAPLVSATAALMKLVNPQITNLEIGDCLRNTAKSMEGENASIAGKVGAGMLQVDAAIECAKQPLDNMLVPERLTPRGTIGIDTRLDTRYRDTTNLNWQIRPAGEYNGLTFLNSVEGDLKGVEISFQRQSGSDKADESAVLWAGKLSDLPASMTLSDANVDITLANPTGARFRFTSQYAVDPIDFEKRYCTGQQLVNADRIISDGSHARDYANSSDCQWLLTYRNGFQITLDFQTIDIDISDKLYLFAGTEPLERNVLAHFSGHDLPRTMNIKNGDALLWFVSDKADVSDGFSINVRWKPVQ